MEVNYNILATFCMFGILNKNFNNKKAPYTNTTYFKQPQIHNPFSEIQKLWKRTVFSSLLLLQGPTWTDTGLFTACLLSDCWSRPFSQSALYQPQAGSPGTLRLWGSKRGAGCPPRTQTRRSKCLHYRTEPETCQWTSGEGWWQCGKMLGGLRTRGCFETKSINLMGGTVEIGGHTRSGHGRGLLSTGLPW